MHPAFSVIFLTTLIGVGQGLFLALYTSESYAAVKLLPLQSQQFYVFGSVIAFLFLGGGLLASFFHLGHPERAWRSAAMWRTSWLSREVIALPIVMGLIFAYGLIHQLGWELKTFGLPTPVAGDLTLIIGAIGTVATFALFVCTGMIYACIRFLQEWANPLTVINYTLLGGASGFVFAAAFASYMDTGLEHFFGVWAIIITIAAMFTRVASLIRNSRIRSRSSVQSAIGVSHARIVQKSQGQMGGSFNTREFFHGAPMWWFRSVKWIFLVLVFPVPLILLSLGLSHASTGYLCSAFVVQYIGLIAERWFFFAQANHPQNIYYQKIS